MDSCAVIKSRTRSSRTWSWKTDSDAFCSIIIVSYNCCCATYTLLLVPLNLPVSKMHAAQTDPTNPFAPLLIIGCLQCKLIPNYSLPPVVVVGLPCQSHGHCIILTTDLTLIQGDSILIGNIRDIFVTVQHKLYLFLSRLCALANSLKWEIIFNEVLPIERVGLRPLIPYCRLFYIVDLFTMR